MVKVEYEERDWAQDGGGDGGGSDGGDGFVAREMEKVMMMATAMDHHCQVSAAV